jgi:hypothetical protein
VAEPLYKFLRQGAIAPFSGHEWREGEWVTVSGELEACSNGVHVCRRRDLPYWLADELWLVDVDGERLELGQKLVVRRAQLRSRVKDWPNPVARDFALDCVWHVRDLAVRELERNGQAEAEELRSCRSVSALGDAAGKGMRRRRPDRPAVAADFLGYAQDAAEFATGDSALAARYVSYIAAHAADRAEPEERLRPGVTCFERERERQAVKLQELGL